MSEESSKKHFPPDGESRETFESNRLEDANLQHVHAQLLREKEEPTENFSPMPLVLVAMTMLLVFWGGLYLVHTSGGFSAFHFDETKHVGGHEEAGPVEIDWMAMGKSVYSKNCQVCHQPDGKGTPGVYPPLAGSDWVKDNPERLIKIVLSGLSGEATINGQTYNNAMTPFGALLKDQQIAAVLTYVRTLPDFGNESYPVAEDMVAQVREEYGARAETWTEADLNAIHGVPDGKWEPPAAPEGEETESEGEEAASEEQEAHHGH